MATSWTSSGDVRDASKSILTCIATYVVNSLIFAKHLLNLIETIRPSASQQCNTTYQDMRSGIQVMLGREGREPMALDCMWAEGARHLASWEVYRA